MKKLILIIALCLPALLLAQQTYVPELNLIDSVYWESVEHGLIRTIIKYNGFNRVVLEESVSMINNDTEPFSEILYTYDDEQRILLYQYENFKYGSKYRRSYNYDLNNHLLSKIQERWLGGEWKYSRIDSMTYDNNGFLFTSIQSEFDPYNGSHYFTVRFTYNRDSVGRIMNSLHQDLDGMNWVNKFKTIYTYNLSGQKDTVLTQKWEGNSWTNQSKQFYSNDTLNKLYSTITQKWSDEWMNLKKLNYQYDEHGNLIYLLEQLWRNNEWNDINKKSYEYNALKKQTRYLEEIFWDSKWENFNQIESTYDERGNLLSETRYTWENNQWEGRNRKTYSFDENNNMLLYLEEWGEGLDWIKKYKYEKVYNEYGSLIKWYNMKWHEISWIDYDSEINIEDSNDNMFYYRSYTGNIFYRGIHTSVKEETNPINKITLSPNPASDYIEINNVILSETKDPVLNVRVYDVLGIEHPATAWHPSKEGNIRIDISSLSPGVYFVSVGGKMYKFVKM